MVFSLGMFKPIILLMSKGLYIHIPFCHGRCHYCNFISVSDPAPELRQRLFLCLSGEMAHARKQYGRLAFDSLYLGGGTPSLLNVSEMTHLLNGIRDAFEIAPDAEVTCEWNPGDGDDEKLAMFRVLGVNRISLGAQSFEDKLLERLGRRHTARDSILTLDKIRRSGITNISLDFMLRIPGQTVEDFRKSLARAIELGVSQVSLYDLEVHSGTPFGKLQEEGALALPDEETHAAMYQAAIDHLTQAGYEHYEISNFAKPGFASKHNLIYWHNREYLGLGPGAFSYLNGVRYQFASDVERYFRKCGTGDWTNDQEDRLSAEEKETESFITGLRLHEGVCPEHFKRMSPDLKNRIDDLLKERLLEGSGGNVRLTDRGKFLSEEAFGFLLRKEQKIF